MQKAATEVMQSILFAAIVDAVTALKDASKGVPNTLLRDLQTIHPNTTFADLPKDVQDSIAKSVRSAFSQLLREGYAVAPPQQGQRSQPLDRVPERERRGPGADRRFVRSGPGRRGPGDRGPRSGGPKSGGPKGGGPKGGPGGGAAPKG